MRAFNRFLIVIYTMTFMIIGCCLVALSLYHVLWQSDLSPLFQDALAYEHFYLILGIIGAILILVSFSFAGIALQGFQKEKTIGFSTEFGNIVVSLSAIEDYIRRMNHHLPELKELRSDVVVSRRGIEISCRVALWSTSNITEMTEKLQTLVKGQVQTLLSGIEKPLFINIYVSKIFHKDTAVKPEDKQELSYLH